MRGRVRSLLVEKFGVEKFFYPQSFYHFKQRSSPYDHWRIRASARASANEASKRQTRVSASLQTKPFQSTGRRSREKTRKTDGGMAPTAGVSRSEAKVPENLRAVSHHGQPMQTQASRESGRSRLPSRGRHGDAGIVERTAAQMPGNGEHQPLESNGWCRPHDEPACEPAWPRVVPAIRALSARVMAQSERLRPQRCGRGLETPSSNRQVKGRRCVAFRSPKGGDNHWTHASSQVCSSTTWGV